MSSIRFCYRSKGRRMHLLTGATGCTGRRVNPGLVPVSPGNSGQANGQSWHEPLEVLQRPGMPGDGLRGEEIKADSILVPGFNDETRQHSDPGAVQEIQLPYVEYDRLGWIDQCPFKHFENGRIILRPGQA